MSTRVQKGVAMFKPIAKPRQRLSNTPSQQTSTPAAEGRRSSVTPSVSRDVAPEKSSMPPPSMIPIRDTSVQLVPPDSDPRDDVMPGKKRKLRHKLRVSSVPPYDPDADPGEEIDPTAVTMATLCKDIGQGRVSSKAVQIQNNHAAWKASNREKRAKMKAAMELKKYGTSQGDVSPPAGNAETTETMEESSAETGSSRTPVTALATSSTMQDDEPTAPDESGHGFDYSQSVSTSRYNVQVRIGPNGETVIDEESLFVDRNEDEGTENYTHVEESDTTKFVNSGTYGKKFRGSRWSAEETELFFDALSQFGENYELISYILPGRDRTSCKNKFKAEDRKNSHRINYCLNNRRPYDMQTLSRMTGKDFSGPTPEIRAPTPLTLIEKPTAPDVVTSTSNTRKNSCTPHLGSRGEEIALAEFNQDKDD